MNKALYPAKVQQTIEALHTKPASTTPDLRQRVTDYAARLSVAQSSQVANTPLAISEKWAAYLKKVTLHAYKTVDEDVEQLKTAGHSEDEIFELTLCAALGAGLARLEYGLAALKGE